MAHKGLLLILEHTFEHVILYTFKYVRLKVHVQYTHFFPLSDA